MAVTSERGVRPKGGGGGGVFGKAIYPISTMGADYANHSNTCPLGFSDLVTALMHTLYIIFPLICLINRILTG